MIIISKEQRDLYCSTVERLTRIGLKDPTRQIIALAEEIDQNRQTIQALRYELDKPPAPLKSIDEVSKDGARHPVTFMPCTNNRKARKVWIALDLAKGQDVTVTVKNVRDGKAPQFTIIDEPTDKEAKE